MNVQFQNLHNIGYFEEVSGNVQRLYSIKRSQYFDEEEINREVVISGVRKMKKGKSAGKYGNAGLMIKNGGKNMTVWI